MNTIISILLFILMIKFAFRILPNLIGFALSILFGLICMSLVLCFLPMMLGLLFFGGDILIILLLLMLIRKV